MANFLINFAPGEKVKASETNSNNQYLLSLISDSAVKIQTFVEGQLNAMQSNLNSVQQTLQNSINSLTANINSMVIQKYYQNGDNWYIKIKITDSLGFCFQGGLGPLATKNYQYDNLITLLVPYRNTNYVVTGSAEFCQTAGDKGSSWRVTNQTTTNFNLGYSFENGSSVRGQKRVRWVAMGFINL